MTRLTSTEFRAMKRRGERIVMLTAYDYPTARILDAAGVPALLVGDSLGTTVLGYETTIPVTLQDVIHHTRAVVRGTQKALIIADLPFMTYHPNRDDALRNAGRLLQEGGAQAVKLEGGASVVETVRRLVEAGVPVQGHLGLIPQSVHQLGGYRRQARTDEAARKLLDDARSLEQAGAFSIVLELIPAALAGAVTQALSIPTIGIGAGPACDGQVQVINDILGLSADFHPRHARQYANLVDVIQAAVARYAAEVRDGSFPGPDESFGLAVPSDADGRPSGEGS
jgi:3-methyl-2-oxobutanoate hydroxymethyltransferase